jgi:hypothetical protein
MLIRSRSGNLNSTPPPPVFRGICVARSLAFCVMFVIVCPFSFGHCVVCPSI